MIANHNIRVLIMDVDGTLTDGKIYMGQSGEVFKAFSIKDGYGIHDMLIPTGIRPVIITGRVSDIVRNRCKELGIEDLHQGVKDKRAKLYELLDAWNCGIENMAYIGDDLNDFDCMKCIKEAGGLIGCPADAVDAVKEIADFISAYKGGDGAVRNFIEHILPLCKEYQEK